MRGLSEKREIERERSLRCEVSKMWRSEEGGQKSNDVSFFRYLDHAEMVMMNFRFGVRD